MMKMKKIVALWMVLCLSMGGCAFSQANKDENTEPVVNPTPVATDEFNTIDGEHSDGARIISPLPDTTMENLTDAILSISLDEGNAYVDDNGRMQMDLKIYTYDKYDMVDIAALKVGDTIVRHSGEVQVISKGQNDAGTIYINGGFENNGFDLITDDSGVFYEVGFNDTRNWYQIGEATIRVSVDFIGIDNADLEQGEVIIYPGDFLIGAVTNYDFTPYNTTIRVEDGQIIGMNRVYVP